MPGAVTPTEFGFLEEITTYQSEAELISYHGDTHWRVNGSTIHDYSRRAYLQASPTLLHSLICEAMADFATPVGIDIAAGSTPYALLNLLDAGVLDYALATSFIDNQRDVARNHPRLDHLAGDLAAPDTWRQMVDWQEEHAADGLALVMHRPVGGLQDLPFDAYYGAAHFLLDMIQPGGIFFTQVPRSVVDSPAQRDKLCASVASRADVVDIVHSAPQGKGHADESDHYVAIIK